MNGVVSRRGFLAGAGMFAVGAVAGSGLSPARLGATEEAGAAPWPYVELDVEEMRKRGHLGYYQHECAEGSFSAIIGVLAEKIGPPYTQIPTRLLNYGGGGVAGWCTLCGAVNGSCAAISLIAQDNKPLCDELLKWFTQTALPTDMSNNYAKNHQFLVEKYKSDKELPQVVTTSPLCHVVVTKWCKASGFASGDKERSERCARMTGDVVAKTVELLNAAHAGAFTSAYDYPGDTNSCRSCHAKGKPFETGGWTRGKMGCESCHGESAKVVGKDHGKTG